MILSYAYATAYENGAIGGEMPVARDSAGAVSCWQLSGG